MDVLRAAAVFSYILHDLTMKKFMLMDASLWYVICIMYFSITGLNFVCIFGLHMNCLQLALSSLAAWRRYPYGLDSTTFYDC